jgi:hypothetical protein
VLTCPPNLDRCENKPNSIWSEMPPRHIGRFDQHSQRQARAGTLPTAERPDSYFNFPSLARFAWFGVNMPDPEAFGSSFQFQAKVATCKPVSLSLIPKTAR